MSLIEVIDDLLTYKILIDGKPNKESYDSNHIRVMWGNRIYLDLEMYDNDFYLSVFLDQKDDLGYIEVFNKIYEKNEKVDKIEKNTGYIRYMFNIDRNAENLNFFIKLRGL